MEPHVVIYQVVEVTSDSDKGVFMGAPREASYLPCPRTLLRGLGFRRISMSHPQDVIWALFFFWVLAAKDVPQDQEGRVSIGSFHIP